MADTLKKESVKAIVRIAQAIGWRIMPDRWMEFILEGQRKADFAHAEIKGASAAIEQRARERMHASIVTRQENVESIFLNAIPLIQPEASNQIGDAWISTFIEQCQNARDEQVRQLWSRILAGEINCPGSFSMRTLSIVRYLTREDAELFTSYCRFLVKATGFGIIDPSFDSYDYMLEQSGLGDEEFVHLDAIGLVSFSRLGRIGYEVVKKSISIEYYGRKMRIVSARCDIHWDRRSRSLTGVGRELYNLAVEGTKPVDGLLDYLGNYWRGFSGCRIDYDE